MPVPGRKFEAEMLFRAEVARHRARQADNQEDRADDYVSAVEAGRHEKSGAIDVTTEVEVRMRIFVSLHAGESQAQQDCEDQTPFQSLPVVSQQGMMRPRYRGACREQDQRIEQRQVAGMEGLDP